MPKDNKQWNYCNFMVTKYHKSTCFVICQSTQRFEKKISSAPRETVFIHHHSLSEHHNKPVCCLCLMLSVIGL